MLLSCCAYSDMVNKILSPPPPQRSDMFTNVPDGRVLTFLIITHYQRNY